MRTEVVGRNVEVTEAIRQHATAKAEKLAKYADLVQQVTMTLSKEDHFRHGTFQAELIIDVEHHKDFVVHAKHEDLYAAIDEVVHKGLREVSEFKARLKDDKR